MSEVESLPERIGGSMRVHLVDGTYELFRHYFALPSTHDSKGREVGAVVGVLGSLLGMLRDGVTHMGMATDHVVESFRNQLWDGYKTGEGIEPELFSQFPILEDAVRAMGVVVWPMDELEADDGLASAAAQAAQDARVERIYICTPDKDLSQCVVGDRVVQLDRRAREVRDAAGVEKKFGVKPTSIPDWLGLVGDSADGFPGLPGWGAKSAATVLARFEHLEKIPKSHTDWDIPVRGAARLADTLQEQWERALLFRDLATLRTEADLFDSVDELRWSGPTTAFEKLCHDLGDPSLYARARAAAANPPRAAE
jgi:5'-3' exonuclease